MIERIEMPEGTIGFRVHGEIKRSDYTDVLVPALDEEVEKGGGLCQLYVIDRLERMDPAALWEDARTGFDLAIRRHTDWRRTAIVTDQEWLASAARLFAWMAPGEVKIYPMADLEEAKGWVAAGSARST
ncbi:MAG TPA: STAS/SEC14 domain-containing protein [Myxococcota bacterium]|nr:STAS/SEC14 domain-containing protein [Myxococcota bacterium]